MSIKENLSQILREIESLNLDPPREISIIAASKSQPTNHLEEAFQAGVRNFGSNYVHEFIDQKSKLEKGVHWHFIGNIQSNKLKKIVGVCELIHSLGKVSTLVKVNKLASEMGITQKVLLQVNLSGEISKNGFSLEVINEVLREAISLNHILVCGLMTMPPIGEGEIYFRQLSDLRKKLNVEFKDKLNLRYLSMGTSDDYLEAIKAGATHIRLGTVLMGQRRKL